MKTSGVNHVFSLWTVGQVGSKTPSNFARALGCSPELNDNTLLLKTAHFGFRTWEKSSWNPAANLLPTGKFSQCQEMLCRLLGGGRSGGGTIGALRYANGDMYVMEITNYFQIWSDDSSIHRREFTQALWKSSQKPIAGRARALGGHYCYCFAKWTMDLLSNCFLNVYTYCHM